MLLHQISYDVMIVFSDWIGRHHVHVVHLDDYDIIIGLELLQQMRAAVIPHLLCV